MNLALHWLLGQAHLENRNWTSNSGRFPDKAALIDKLTCHSKNIYEHLYNGKHVVLITDYDMSFLPDLIHPEYLGLLGVEELSVSLSKSSLSPSSDPLNNICCHYWFIFNMLVKYWVQNILTLSCFKVLLSTISPFVFSMGDPACFEVVKVLFTFVMFAHSGVGQILWNVRNVTDNKKDLVKSKLRELRGEGKLHAWHWAHTLKCINLLGSSWCQSKCCLHPNCKNLQQRLVLQYKRRVVCNIVNWTMSLHKRPTVRAHKDKSRQEIRIHLRN